MKRYFPVAVFLSVALASLGAAVYAWQAGQEAGRARFEAVADEALNRIAGRLAVHMSLMRATQALLETSGGTVSRSAFRSYFDALGIDSNYAGLRGLGVLRVSRSTEDTAAAEAEIARLHGIEAKIHPPSDAPVRTPIVLYEPLDADSVLAIGYDMYSETRRRAAIERTLSTDEPAATGLLALAQSVGTPFPGFLVFQRLDTLVPSPGVGAPETTASGVVFLSYRSRDLFETALATAPLLPVHVEVRDTAVGQGNMVFESAAPADAAFGDEFTVTRTLAFADATWSAILRPTAAFASDMPTLAAPLLIGGLGLVLAAALAAASRYQIRAWDAASALRDSAERSLAEKDLMLQEMKHRIKNSIARVLAIARQTAAGAEGLDDFTRAFSARMQAMAASQDMLTRSRWQKADVGELLRTELQQVFGDVVPDEMVSGPRVLLDESTTQALGLTFHELATNAMKYGNIAGLRIAWSVRRNQSPRMLDLHWEEAGKPIVPPEKPGFGTRLIDMNITRELGGMISRDYGTGGLRITISIPLARQ